MFKPNEMMGVLGQDFCTVRLYWAGDNLGDLLVSKIAICPGYCLSRDNNGNIDMAYEQLDIMAAES